MLNVLLWAPEGGMKEQQTDHDHPFISIFSFSPSSLVCVCVCAWGRCKRRVCLEWHATTLEVCSRYIIHKCKLYFFVCDYRVSHCIRLTYIFFSFQTVQYTIRAHWCKYVSHNAMHSTSFISTQNVLYPVWQMNQNVYPPSSLIIWSGFKSLKR